ncbi:hypothetical protein [Acanthamoeba castellanii mimivirus]|uniref:Uncharacterized protein n=1 Tax=Acanthamoeba castellanii mimivirus TaxID=1899318 RepID=A0A1E1EUV3_9VIRU|nr:hypothetical protein [Acanthamoeba castellanii mimivirus]BAV63027.1 hypothetical protein [Acanthamoeba castellanii mimivirus]
MAICDALNKLSDLIDLYSVPDSVSIPYLTISFGILRVLIE